MPITDDATASDALKRAALYAAYLQAIRRARCQIDSPRNDDRRELLENRLDAIDVLAADIFARMVEARAT